MLNAAWRGAGRLGVAEEVGEADFGLDDVGVRVGAQTRGCHERDMDRLPASERAAEGGDFFVARNLRKNRRKVNRNPTYRRLCYRQKTGEKSKARMDPAARPPPAQTSPKRARNGSADGPRRRVERAGRCEPRP